MTSLDSLPSIDIEVLQLHVSCDGLVGCSPLSLMPVLKVPFEKSIQENLDAIEDVAPTESLHQLVKVESGPALVCPPQKTSTRQKLLAVNQSLKHLLNVTLADALPLLHLRPPEPTEKRIVTQKDGQPVAYYWDQMTKEVAWQTTSYPGFGRLLRLSCLTDEGDVTAALQMAQHGMAILIHRDTQHKLQREQMMAMNECPNVDLAMREAILVLKFQSAPWSTGIFGRRLKEAQARIDEIPADHVLIQICQAGIINDLGMDPMTSCTEIKAVLVKHARGKADFHGLSGQTAKLARWGDFVDGMYRLRKQWHLFLFWMLFALALEGKSPWAALAAALEHDSNKEILPRVLRVP